MRLRRFPLPDECHQLAAIRRVARRVCRSASRFFEKPSLQKPERILTLSVAVPSPISSFAYWVRWRHQSPGRYWRNLQPHRHDDGRGRVAHARQRVVHPSRPARRLIGVRRRYGRRWR